MPARKPAAPKENAPRKARQAAVLPKSDGDAGVQAYITSMEPWQAAIARRVDALVVEHVPGVRKAIRWHTPLYGVEGRGWFLAFNAFQYYVKVAFFKGTSLDPLPPVAAAHETRYLHVREHDELDEAQLVSWIRQAAAPPGWGGGRPRAERG